MPFRPRVNSHAVTVGARSRLHDVLSIGPAPNLSSTEAKGSAQLSVQKNRNRLEITLKIDKNANYVGTEFINLVNYLEQRLGFFLLVTKTVQYSRTWVVRNANTFLRDPNSCEKLCKRIFDEFVVPIGDSKNVNSGQIITYEFPLIPRSIGPAATLSSTEAKGRAQLSVQKKDGRLEITLNVESNANYVGTEFINLVNYLEQRLGCVLVVKDAINTYCTWVVINSNTSPFETTREQLCKRIFDEFVVPIGDSKKVNSGEMITYDFPLNLR